MAQRGTRLQLILGHVKPIRNLIDAGVAAPVPPCHSADNQPIDALILSELPNIRQCLESQLDAISKLSTSNDFGCLRSFENSKSVRFEFCDNSQPKRVNDLVKKARIILADPDMIKPYLKVASELKWLQSEWAGNEGLLAEMKTNNLKHFKLTRIGGAFGPLISEYCLGQIISRERDFPGLIDAQRYKAWSKRHSSYRTLDELTVGILGVGTIGLHIAKVLKQFGSTTIGLARSTSGKISQELDKKLSQKDLPILLNQCDYVINTLPNTSETIGMLSGNVLSKCKPSCVFINVGRGAIIDDQSLLHALNRKWIAAAILDVFNTEPLPPTHPFWDHEQIIITPHNSGVSFARDIARIFTENLELFLNDKPLRYSMDVERGY